MYGSARTENFCAQRIRLCIDSRLDCFVWTCWEGAIMAPSWESAEMAQESGRDGYGVCSRRLKVRLESEISK